MTAPDADAYQLSFFDGERPFHVERKFAGGMRSTMLREHRHRSEVFALTRCIISGVAYRYDAKLEATVRVETWQVTDGHEVDDDWAMAKLDDLAAGDERLEDDARRLREAERGITSIGGDEYTADPDKPEDE